MKVKSQYASKQLLRLWQTCLSLRRQRRLRWDCPTATSQEERGGLGQRRMAVRKGRVLLRSLGLCANTFSKKLIWKGRGFLLVSFYLGKKPLKVYLCRMGACWLSTARYKWEAKREICKVFTGLILCLLVCLWASQTDLKWYVWKSVGFGGIVWEGEGREEASELVVCFGFFFFLSVQ